MKPAPEQAPLTTSSGTVSSTSTTDTTGANTPISGSEFLTVLLSVKNISLDDSIFSDLAFTSLHDSSIELISDIPEGRPNPFAPIGSDIIPTATVNTTTNTSTSTNPKLTP